MIPDSIKRSGLMLLLLAGGSWWLMPPRAPNLDPGTRFEEIAERAGCRNTQTMVALSPRFSNIMPWLSSVGAAVAAGDFDGDGRTDLYVIKCGRGSANRLYRNRGDGTFEDVAAAAGVACGNPEGACVHAIFGDVNNDGWLDLYVTKWAAPNQLFLNRGDGTFRDVSVAAGVNYWGYGNAATFVDYDRDGRLDILVGNYFAEEVVDPRTGKLARAEEPGHLHHTLNSHRVQGRRIGNHDHDQLAAFGQARGNNLFRHVAHHVCCRSIDLCRILA
jgi:hypothetical protein